MNFVIRILMGKNYNSLLMLIVDIFDIFFMKQLILLINRFISKVIWLFEVF